MASIAYAHLAFAAWCGDFQEKTLALLVEVIGENETWLGSAYSTEQ